MSRRFAMNLGRRPDPPSTGVVLVEPWSSRLRRLLPIYGLVLPGLLLFATWALIPILQSFVMSFTDWKLRGDSSFVGLDNYVRALNDPLFWRALSATIGYTVVTVAGQMVLGLSAALLRRRSRGLRERRRDGVGDAGVVDPLTGSRWRPDEPAGSDHGAPADVGDRERARRDRAASRSTEASPRSQPGVWQTASTLLPSGSRTKPP